MKLEILSESIRDVIPFDGAAVFTDGDYRSTGTAPTKEEFLGLARFLNTTPPGQVYETQFPYLASDYKTDNLRERDLSQAFELGSCICVPIKNRKEEVLGFFQLHRQLYSVHFRH